MTANSKSTTIRAVFPFKDLQVWQQLVVGLKSKNRFTLDEEPARFVDLLIDYAKTHKTVTFKRDTVLYRARMNGTDREVDLPLDKMGAPPGHLAGHGRLNPRGIPYLYLASNRDTAVSEIRPWVGCRITVATFALAENCELVNFSGKHLVKVPQGEKFEGSEWTWRDLVGWMFGAPFDPRDDTAYIPTQFLAERIKEAGFAGIMYDSSLSPDGYNVTLFDVNLATPKRRETASVTSMTVEANYRDIEPGKDGKE